MSYQLGLSNELIVDNFAGGGGASTGIELALNRPVNISVNHDPEAVAMHSMNHRITRHFCEDVWDVDPQVVTFCRKVGLAWFSPDCKHFSKAKGAALRDRKIRGLAWVVLRWAAKVRPRVICIENVEEFTTWGPLTPEGFPDPAKKGVTFRSFVHQLQGHGYRVEWRELCACDYGAPTIRKRFILIARCDGRPIVWPLPTHGDPRKPGFRKSGLKPWKTAAECIDWSMPCPSIFGRTRPLADNTLARIARGIRKFVIEAQEPFILNISHGGRLEPAMEPLRTITCAARGEKAIIIPQLVGAGGPVYSGKARPADEPMNTLLAQNHTQLCTAFLAKHFGGVTGVSVETPMPTIMTRGTQTQLVTSHVMKMRGANTGHAVTEPVHTISAGGTHHAEVRAFLLKYYGNERDAHGLTHPIGTVTTKDRFGLVTIRGEDYAIVDIGMRMLTPRELYRAQGFPDSYVIDRGLFRQPDGSMVEKPLTKTAQVRMCGNSVCPPLARAVVAANVSISDMFVEASE